MLLSTTEAENNEILCGETQQCNDNLHIDEQIENDEEFHDYKNVQKTVLVSCKKIKLQLIELPKLVDSLMHPVCKQRIWSQLSSL